MKKNIIAILALVLMFSGSACTKEPSNGAKNTANPTNVVVSPTPDKGNSNDQTEVEDVEFNKDNDFTLEDLDGNKVTLSQFAGKKIYLNFWAVWCPPCVAELPHINEISQENKDVVVVTVNLDNKKETVLNFNKKNGYNFITLWDPKGDLDKKYKLDAIPVSVFLDRKGNIVERKVGSMQKEEMLEILNSIE